ncbi:MAG: hypothetical protein KAS29_06310 [Bacteroidales bacterium]|nr:hypothetical protein [Bacteroidales bacterium]
MKKIVLLMVLLVFACATGTWAQSEIPDRKGKLFLVPELWLSFGTNSYIEVAPLVGYHVNDRLSVGLGPHYIYQSQKATPYYPVSYQTHSYGLKGFARFALITNADQFLPINLFSDLFVHMEYEGMSLEKAYYYAPAYPDDGRFIYQGFLVGGGFSQRVGMFNSVSFTVLWNLNESSRSPYSNPVFRIGFNTYF